MQKKHWQSIESSLSRRRFSSLGRWDDGDEGLLQKTQVMFLQSNLQAEQAYLVPVGGQLPESSSRFRCLGQRLRKLTNQSAGVKNCSDQL